MSATGRAQAAGTAPPGRRTSAPGRGRYSSGLALRRMIRNVISAPSRPEMRMTTIRGAWRWKTQKSIRTLPMLASANQPSRMPSTRMPTSRTR